LWWFSVDVGLDRTITQTHNKSGARVRGRESVRDARPGHILIRTQQQRDNIPSPMVRRGGARAIGTPLSLRTVVEPSDRARHATRNTQLATRAAQRRYRRQGRPRRRRPLTPPCHRHRSPPSPHDSAHGPAEPGPGEPEPAKPTDLVHRRDPHQIASRRLPPASNQFCVRLLTATFVLSRILDLTSHISQVASDATSASP
jgi:hypothetical protein